jgi:glutathione synthase/RimK-type ligase-like ATP-grasp enzyme
VLPRGTGDDYEAAKLLGAAYRSWDDPGVDWEAYDRVVIRSTWDYTQRIGEFLAWCGRVGSRRLRNRPELIAFNADKRYLERFAAASVPTIYLAPGDPTPALEGEVVVKPNVSSGARDTGRFGPRTHHVAVMLIERIQASGRVALVQPYIESLDKHGETALVYIGGELSHVVNKRAILRPNEIAPTSAAMLGVATAMLASNLVTVATATVAERTVADYVLREISANFGTPLYARIDLVRTDDGAPLLLELELIEPNLYLKRSPGAAARLACCVRES